jgi:catechol 2,3-dioxygenase-like lactoylglutathione lyase family enzyme
MKKLAVIFSLIPLLFLPRLLTGADAPKRPKILGVAHMAFYVSDLAKAREFWIDLLGYEEVFNLKKKNSNEVRIAFIKISDFQYIELFAEEPRDGERLNHISFATDNAEAMRDYLFAKGVKVPAKVAVGQIGNKNYNITDPSGNLVEIVEYQPSGWTVREKGKFMSDRRISDHIAHIGVFIGSMEANMAFYNGILGFTEFWRGGGSVEQGKPLSWINMRVPDGDDYLEWMLYSTKPEPSGRGTKNHLCLVVPDVQKAIDILQARPAFKNYGRKLEMALGVNRKRQANLYDPDGSRVEIMEPTTIDGKPTPPSNAPVPMK